MIPQIIDYLTHPVKYVIPDADARIDPETGSIFKLKCKTLQEVLPVQFLGSGAFSCAYGLPDGSAVKIVRGTDKPYHEFIKYALENPDNPALPKIHEVIPVQGEQYIYHMEKLCVPVTSAHRSDCHRLSQAVIYDECYGCPHIDRILKEYGTANFNDIKPANMGRRDGQLVFMDPTATFKGRGMSNREFRGGSHLPDFRIERAVFPRFRDNIVEHVFRMQGFADGGVIHERAVQNKVFAHRHGKPIRPHDHIIGKENLRDGKVR